MSAGLKVYDSSGQMLLDMTSSVSQMMGYVDTGAANGSRSIPLPPAGKQLFYAITELSAQNKYLGKRPGVTLTIGASSATLSWQYSYASGWGFYSLNCRIHYGYH
ncbi:hypothetical protein NJF44_10800 [Pseudomonas guariconensis]|uniref:hypothetical protein n=1 Tax=Pseudomonas TaxID=286 RepID=UPI002096D479|nr:MULTISPECIES: hypothetical protein [Pseudomonas]MCO7515689.1 hypothetical protein [Pseudomonas putida]MCO7595080.1 hypothetical protein [Pseudomonas guariconensis]MCO7605718.1 hypothetical protein [Pseudomonas guariconensis]MCO7634150.1 hypothetical protein [Pseudomonas guariconensis]MCU7221040.1 hypothetical protein [Pseudomonas brassicacearum]